MSPKVLRKSYAFGGTRMDIHALGRVCKGINVLRISGDYELDFSVVTGGYVFK
jgi:hypothetical protein